MSTVWSCPAAWMAAVVRVPPTRAPSMLTEKSTSPADWSSETCSATTSGPAPTVSVGNADAAGVAELPDVLVPVADGACGLIWTMSGSRPSESASEPAALSVSMAENPVIGSNTDTSCRSPPKDSVTGLDAAAFSVPVDVLYCPLSSAQSARSKVPSLFSSSSWWPSPGSPVSV